MAAPFPYAPDGDYDYARIIHEVRSELETAGNPAYVVVLIDPAGGLDLSPMVFATIHPAAELARRLKAAAAEGTEALIVSRQADRRRAQLSVLDPATLRKRHEQLEVIEPTFAEIDGPL